MSRVLDAQEYTTRMKNKRVAQTYYTTPQPAYNYVHTSFVANQATQVVQVLDGPNGWYTYSERCGIKPTFWNPVIGGPEPSLGTATESSEGVWNLIGPDGQDAVGDGWTYIYKYYPVDTVVTYTYNWTTDDDSGFDWPFEYQTSLFPGTEANIDSYISNAANTYITNLRNEQGVRTVSVPGCSYLVLGVYSDDSTAGPGILGLNIQST